MDYSRYMLKASAKIARFGSEAVFESGQRQYDPLTGQMNGEITEMAAMAVLTSPGEEQIASGSVQQGDGILLAASLELDHEPAINSLVRFAGQEWRVVSVNRVAPDGAPILYKIHVRRA